MLERAVIVRSLFTRTNIFVEDHINCANGRALSVPTKNALRLRKESIQVMKGLLALIHGYFAIERLS